MGTLSGVLPILPTIFSPSGAIDEAGTRRVVEYIIGSGRSSSARVLRRPTMQSRSLQRARRLERSPRWF
jgi:hypothetical protein